MSNEEITVKRVEQRLAKISKGIKENNKLNLSDINIICEEVFGRILNKLFDLRLTALTAEVSSTYVAVDLIDKEKRVAFQVTSRRDRGKISDTIEKFVKNRLNEKIDKLYVLILNIEPHEYQRGEEEINIGTKYNFKFSENVIDFIKLIELISDKEKDMPGFIIGLYNDISMVFDSGRLKYNSIVEKTKSMSGFDTVVSNIQAWKKGTGDVTLYAYIPKNYRQTISCSLEFRQMDLEGLTIAIEQEELLEDYFVNREEFEEKHFKARKVDDDEQWVKLGNIRMVINAHTAFHLMYLFEELREVYQNNLAVIEEELGVIGMEKYDGGYQIAEISKTTWCKIMEFARKHDWGDQQGNEEWNIFNCNCSEKGFYLSPFMYGGESRGDVFAEIKIKEKADEKVAVYWFPGFKGYDDCMNGFDNKIKWKADFTKEWFDKKLLPEIEKQGKKKGKGRKKIFLKGLPICNKGVYNK